MYKFTHLEKCTNFRILQFTNREFSKYTNLRKYINLRIYEDLQICDCTNL